MIHLPRCLLHFEKSADTKMPTDFAEKVANVGLGLLRMGCGKVVRISLLDFRLFFQEENTSKLSRVAGIALAITLLPITLFLTIIGTVGLFFSKSYRDTLRVFESSIHNSEQPFLKLPSEILCSILSKLTTAELTTAALTCRDLSTTPIQICKEKIRMMSKLAKEFDIQVKELTSGRHSLIQSDLKNPHYLFRFDLKKWEQTLDQLQNRKSCGTFEQLLEECRWDLIEALSEYNVDQQLFEETSSYEDRARVRLSVNIDPDDKTEEEIAQELAEVKANRLINRLTIPEAMIGVESKKILEEAKNTMKGNIGIKPGLRYSFQEIFVMYPGAAENAMGPFLPLVISNLESLYWATNGQSNNNYQRHAKSKNYVHENAEYIHVDWLIGKKEGDRLILPKKEGCEQVIFRCMQRRYERRNRRFEQIIVDQLILHTPAIDQDHRYSPNDRPYLSQMLQVCNQALQKIKKA